MFYNSLKLISQKTGIALAEVTDYGIVFFNSELENELRINGINIPYKLKGNFDGKNLIAFSDKLFIKAFVEVYCPIYMKESGFTLVPSNGAHHK